MRSITVVMQDLAQSLDDSLSIRDRGDGIPGTYSVKRKGYGRLVDHFFVVDEVGKL